MKWEEFLKPSFKKITVFLLLTFLAYLIYGFSSNVCISSSITKDHYDELIEKGVEVICEEGSPSCTWCESNPNILAYVSIPFVVLMDDLGWVINLVYLYPLSCLIIWIYEKIRKK